MGKWQNRKGLTLIELVVTFAIFIIVVNLIYSLLFAGNRSFETGRDRGHAQQDARLIAAHLKNELRYSAVIDDKVIDINGKYYSLGMVKEDNITSLIKTEYDAGEIIDTKILTRSKLDEVELRNNNGLIEVLIRVDDNYELPLIIPLENRNKVTDFDVTLSNGTRLYYAYPENIIVGGQEEQ